MLLCITSSLICILSMNKNLYYVETVAQKIGQLNSLQCWAFLFFQSNMLPAHTMSERIDRDLIVQSFYRLFALLLLNWLAEPCIWYVDTLQSLRSVNAMYPSSDGVDI